jgi:hypothetical protein
LQDKIQLIKSCVDIYHSNQTDILALIIVSTNAMFVRAGSSIEPSIMTNGEHYDQGRYFNNWNVRSKILFLQEREVKQL